jgi:hypothetical protein
VTTDDTLGIFLRSLSELARASPGRAPWDQNLGFVRRSAIGETFAHLTIPRRAA